MGTICVTGSASGMGAATAARLRRDGHRVIGVDLRDAEVIADLGTPAGRGEAIGGVADASGGALDGLVTFAGVAGLVGRDGSMLVSINYFGTAVLLDGLRPLLAGGTNPSAVAISSNATTCMPGISTDLVEACLANDEPKARAIGDEVGSDNSYGATKTAVARYVRRHATSAEWIGAGIRLNAIAPGVVDTPMSASVIADPERGELMKGFTLPVGRLGRPEELAALVAFLLGPDSGFFCGSVIWCDGGTDALMRADDWPVAMSMPEG